MTKGQLAEELRRRQYDLGVAGRREIDALSDDEIIWGYITCSCCGLKQLTAAQLPGAVRAAGCAHEFFRICDRMGAINHRRSGRRRRGRAGPGR
jgi:hypothetical protein